MQPPQQQGVQQLQNSNYQMLYQQYLNQCLQQGYDAATAQTLASQYAQQAVVQQPQVMHTPGVAQQVVYAQPAKKSGLGTVGIVAVAIVGIVALVIILSGALYVWASSLAVENAVEVEVFRVESPGFFGSSTACSESFVLEGGEIVYCEFELTRDSNIEITVTLAEGSAKGVDVLTMTSLNFQDYQAGRDYMYFEDLSQMNTKSVFLDGALEENTYYVVVSNSY